MNPTKIIKDKTYKRMYWLVWSNGDRSTDFYNRTWAKHHFNFYGEVYDASEVELDPIVKKPKRRAKKQVLHRS